MDESLFYIAGGALIVIALVVSLYGVRSDRFPSQRALAAGLVVMFLLVAATAIGAVRLSKHEEGEHIEAANAEADVTEAQQTQTGQEAGAGPETTTSGGGASGGGTSGSSVDAGKVFISSGCGSCHTLSQLGSQAQGTIGPDLDTALAGKDDAFIKESIVDPSAYVAKGYPDGTMPANFGTELSSAEIDALVAFLSKSAGN